MIKVWISAGVAVLALVGLTGCGQPAAVPKPVPPAVSEDTHGAWWCPEHGVPEGVCVQCNPKLAADFQAKKDWCEKHERPESQCFICHPEHAAKFAAQYEAKYGTKPPKPGVE